MGRLLDVRYLSTKRYTRIVLVLDRLIGGINHDMIPAQKSFPPRAYIDLTPCIPLRRWSRVPHWIGDAHVGRIRVARNTLQTTRIVFELQRDDANPARYQVKILRRPMRIVIDVARERLPRAPRNSLRLPTKQPQPWRSSQRRNYWSRRPLPARSAYALRHQGPLPKLPFPFKVKTIVIDAGHGGREDGAIGGRYGLREKEVTLDIARRIVRLMRQQLRVKVFMTRRSDKQVSLSQRAILARQREADLLVSIHINAHTDRKISGISTYILDWSSRSFAAQLLSSDPLTARENQGIHPGRFDTVNSILASLKRQSNLILSKILAIAIQQQMLQQVRPKYPIVRDLGVRKGLFYLLFAAQMPSVLVEASYLSNPQEEKLLRTSAYRQEIAIGIVNGLKAFLQHTKHATKKTARRQKNP